MIFDERIVRGLTFQMSYRRRNTNAASRAGSLTKTKRLAAVSSIWLVRREATHIAA
jgi:hypothetical protein